ncbi:hypothetical protein IGI04_024602 [Brassica rapa subsp. trilocularis]|uniref:Uncharacterized protein n=1 Tax=Brassica rapa subsp. trilocularis TaxID=1813537 RepID=A0ABQ7M759_BRACM|nr:hypothetical protein IGI04_024602 [Brassica rapa subsp. trilocularis]
MVIIGFGLYGHGPSNEQKNLGFQFQIKIVLGKTSLSLPKAILFEGDSSHLVSSRLVRRRLAVPLVLSVVVPLVSSVAVPLVSSVAVPLCRVHRRLQPSPSVSLSRLLKLTNPLACIDLFFRMDNEDTLNLNDEDYMSGDELMDQNSAGNDDEAVGVENSLMSTAENCVKRGGDEVNFEPLEEVGEEV